MADKKILAQRALESILRCEVPLRGGVVGANTKPALEYAAKALRRQGLTVPQTTLAETVAGVDAVRRIGNYGSAEALRVFAELY